MYWSDISDFPDPLKFPEFFEGLTPGMANKILNLKHTIRHWHG